MSTLAPENTLAAFRLCREHGVRWFECDVDILADDTVILTHDTTFDRCTNATGGYYHLEKDDIKNIDAGSWFGDEFIGERIPTLEDLFAVMEECNLSVNIEIKSRENTAQRLITNLAQGIKKSHMKERIIVSSFDCALVAEFKKICPDVPVGCIFDMHTLAHDWDATMKWVNATYVNPCNEGLKKEHIEMFKKEGYGVNVWTVNELDRANQLLNWGVDGIITDVAQKFPTKYKFVNVNPIKIE
jgi:glycerophosphoryl diester phosphodiesterase